MGKKPPKDAIVHEYSKLASDYDRRWSGYVHTSLRETMLRADLRRCSNVLDIACGTGTLLLRIRQENPQVRLYGVDISGEMLAVARSKLGPEAMLCRGRAGALPFRDGAFDAIVSTNAFHFFSRPEAVLADFSRVLAPDGRLIITDWCDDYWSCRLCDLVLSSFNKAHRRAYGSKACHALLQEAGFSDVSVERYKINWFWGLMTATGSKPPLRDG